MHCCKYIVVFNTLSIFLNYFVQAKMCMLCIALIEVQDLYTMTLATFTNFNRERAFEK